MTKASAVLYSFLSVVTRGSEHVFDRGYVELLWKRVGVTLTRFIYGLEQAYVFYLNMNHAIRKRHYQQVCFYFDITVVPSSSSYMQTYHKISV